MQIKFLNNQNKAQHVRGVPPSEIMIPYPNIRSLLESQTNFFKDKIFIIYEDEKISYNDFFKKVNQFSNFLINNNFDQNNLYSIYSNKPFFFLIELFAIWNIGGKINLSLKNNIRVDFEKIFKNYNSKFIPIKKNKFYDICIQFQNKNGKTIFLSEYNLLITAKGISNNFNENENNLFMYFNPFKNKLNLIFATLSSLYLGAKFKFLNKNHNFIKCNDITTLFIEEFFFSPKIKNIICPHYIFKSTVKTNFKVSFYSSDISGYISINMKNPKILMKNFISIGFGMNHCELAIINNKGNILPDGKIGELVIRGHNIMEKINGIKNINNYFKYGWFHSGYKGIIVKNEIFIQF